MRKILVTGAAGFIGYHVSKALLDLGDKVIGLDNLNDYYDVQLKKDRLSEIEKQKSFDFVKMDIADREEISALFQLEQFDCVLNFAAQAGVRYSLNNPNAYVDSNLVGFVNLLEGCRHNHVNHFVYASSSSVYGANENIPFSVHDNVDHPVSLYAATKKSNELMAHTYSHLYQLPTTGLRLFTVYGPWGRPDMALFLFTQAILEGKPIEVFNYGKMKRDFTYIDDIVTGVLRVLDQTAESNSNWNGKQPDPATSLAPWKIYNIGNNQPVELMIFINTLEKVLGMKTKKNMMPLQDGDVPVTFANIDDLEKEFGFSPNTSLEFGIGEFVKW